MLEFFLGCPSTTWSLLCYKQYPMDQKMTHQVAEVDVFSEVENITLLHHVPLRTQEHPNFYGLNDHHVAEVLCFRRLAVQRRQSVSVTEETILLSYILILELISEFPEEHHHKEADLTFFLEN